ncbi:hypothetical protein METP3_02167 [Methanosarcinales archaeon]|nr:hypothetical protein METP3_02167 [Methanosarcinales archaeon]
MNAKFTLAIIALVGIGVFALPSTMSLFAGQHSFYNIDATGNQVPCQKCHGDVKAELTSNSNTISDGPHAAFKCEYCHRIEQGAASGDNAYGRVPYENATGGMVRYLILGVADMEAGNFPATINGSDVLTNSNRTIAGVTLKYGKAAISPVTADATLTAAPKPDLRIYPTYNATSGSPIDTNPATAETGLDLSKATVSSTGVVSLINAGSKAVNPGSAYHAASLVSCMECHGGEEPMGHYTRVVESPAPCSNCHYGGSDLPGSNRWTALAAGGFNLTGDALDTGTSEAHNAWVQTDDGINRYGGPNGEANNGACIGCHTHVAIDINFEKGYKLAFDAIETAEGVYSVSNAAVEGKVKVAIYGNGSGETFGVGDKSYTWTPTQTLYVNGDGAVITGLDGESSDSEAALTN